MQYKLYAKIKLSLLYLVLILLSLVAIFPILWVVLSSFKPAGELFAYPPTFFAKHPTLGNYIGAFARGNFLVYFRNTLFVAVTATLLTIALNVAAGYVFAKYTFRFQKLLFALILSTIMVPLEVVMVPVFKVIVALNLFDNLWGLIIPAVASPTSIFLVRQYYASIPNEFMEASRIDGASESSIFLKVMLPMATTVVSVLCIISFMWRWNDFLWPKLVLQTRELFTLQLALMFFSGEYSVDWNSLLAMSSITVMPVAIVFVIFQKYIIDGITAGGVKG